MCVYPEPQNVTLFVNKVFADEVRGGHNRLGWILNPKTGKLTRREENTEIHTEKHRKESQVDRDRDWSNTDTRQGIPKIGGSHQMPGRNKKRSFPKVFIRNMAVSPPQF